MDQTDLEQPTPETTAKDSNQSYVVKLLRDITLAEATGPLLPGKLDICDIPVEKKRELTTNLTESEDKSLALPGNVVESLVSPSCGPKEIVLKLKENLHLDQADLEKPSAETTRMFRCLAATAKDSNRIDVVKHLREIMPAGTTGPLLPGKLDIGDIPDEKTRELTINLTESEDKSLALPGNVVESLVSPSCDPKEIVLKLKENLHLDQADLEKPSAETTRMIRCLAATAKDSNRIDVVKHLREIMPAGTTGGFACSIWLSVNSFIQTCYGVCSWDGCSDWESELLESVQCEAVKVVTGATRETRRIRNMGELEWEEMKVRRDILKGADE
ncbi:PREDICTED: uncharacterized protein LOC107353680 [Acropora digitifera]|uniref:uncharacterized protein LOC107353680 n=1 Tax=Acropora digitifera TaxID=70779 RepID=UPI00077B1C0A|nr:PREDICTED: uncharacterized protein LOC107353680 [Acropora digitifera]